MGGLALFDELDEPVLLVAQPLEQAGKARLQRLGDQPALGAAARFAGFDEKHGEIGGQRGVGILRGLRLAQCPGEIVVPLAAVGQPIGDLGPVGAPRTTPEHRRLDRRDILARRQPEARSERLGLAPGEDVAA